MGNPSSARRLRRQGVLRVVRRPDRLHVHHESLQQRVETVVATGAGQKDRPVPVHGQGQRSVPLGYVPGHAARHRQGPHARVAHHGHRISQLRGRQVQQESRHRRVR
uniref:(northern house mosquito) hypothetical protein n=1 Tax=Culex pipiens TaxID=7175 RepID=A0A8D8FX30_CULPI